MRISIVSSKNAKNIYIIQSYRVNGKSTTKIYKKLGTVEELLPKFNNNYDKLVAWAKNEAKIATNLLKEEKQDITITYPSTQLEKDLYSKYNGGYLFIQSLFYELKLDHLCNKIATTNLLDYDLTSYLSILLYTHLLYPHSQQPYQKISASLLEEYSIDIVKMYQALDIFSKEKNQFEAFLYKQSKHIFSKQGNQLHVIHTNHAFESDSGYRVRNYNNENNPTVNVYYLVDENHLPLSYFTQNIHMNRKLVRLINEDFKDSDLTVMQDSILPSETITALKEKKKETITIQSIQNLPSRIREWVENYNGWFLYGSKEPYSLLSIEDSKDIYFYKERTVNIDNNTKRIIALYNPKTRLDKQDSRQTNICELKNLLEHSLSNKTKAERNNPKVQLIDLIDQISFHDGIVVLTTTTNLSIQSLIEHYRHHQNVQDSFSIVKHDIKTRTIFLPADSRANVHFSTNFLCLYFKHLLIERIGSTYSISEILKSLRDMKFKKISDIGYLSLYTRNDITDAIHDAFDFRLDNEIYTNKKMQDLITHTKQHINNKNERD